MQSRTVMWKFVLNKAKKINTLVAGNAGNEKNLYQAAAKKQKKISIQLNFLNKICT